jgi:hypothetical protein
VCRQRFVTSRRPMAICSSVVTAAYHSAALPS